MTTRPEVSVIIPTYDRAQVINRAIQSVLDQTFSNFEIIIIDDGSTDNTEEVVKGLGDSRIRYIRHDTNRGASAARNTGLNLVRGDYIGFLDSDDEWLPTKLARQMELFTRDDKGDLGLVLCEVLVRGPSSERRIVPKLKLITYENLLSHRADAGYFMPQFLIKCALAGTELYFDEDLPSSEDWSLLLRLARICRIDYVPEVLVRIHTDSVNRISNLNTYLISRLKILEKYDTELKAHPKVLRSCYLDVALAYYSAEGQLSDVRRYLKAAIKINPVNPTGYIGLAFSIFGRPGLWMFVKLTKSLPARIMRLGKSD